MEGFQDPRASGEVVCIASLSRHWASGERRWLGEEKEAWPWACWQEVSREVAGAGRWRSKEEEGMKKADGEGALILKEAGLEEEEEGVSREEVAGKWRSKEEGQ